jgi:hypothetical protein
MAGIVHAGKNGTRVRKRSLWAICRAGMVGDLDVRRLGCVLHARVQILDSPAQVGPLRQSAVVDVINTIAVSAGRLVLLGVASRRQIRCFRSSAGFFRRVRFPAAPQQKALGVGVLCAAGGLRLLAALGRVGGDALEQCVECGLLLGVKGRKHALFCGSECVLYLCQSARSCRREAHRMAAPVLRGASALD